MVKKKLMFLCTGNSCRSQMAEGWGKYLLSDRFEVYSAGITKHGLNPLAVQVMKEAGVDISTHYSKTPEELNLEYDLVVTVCSNADQTCPSFGGANVVHVGFDDPPGLAKSLSDPEEILQVYRRVRDEIKVKVAGLADYKFID